MSQQFHLHTCIFRIHRFNTKLLGTDNLNLFVLQEFILHKLFLEVSSCLLLIDDLGFIFAKLTLDDFLYQVDGYIHIAAHLLGTNNVSFYRDGNFNLLSVFFHTQGYMNLCLRSKIPFQLTKLFLYG